MNEVSKAKKLDLGHEKEPFWPLILEMPDKSCRKSSIFFRKHQISEDKQESSRSIFITGLPLQIREPTAVEALFRHFGNVQSVALHPSKVCLALRRGLVVLQAADFATTSQITVQGC